jgi:hypothetical protein
VTMTDTLLDTVAAVDPLDADELRRWQALRSFADLDLTSSSSDGTPVVTPGSRRRVRLGRAAIAGVVVVGLGVGAAAAATVLGQHAPARVQQHLAGLDAGLPVDLRLNPDVRDARAVATTAHGTLYLADLADGGYCLEVVSDGDQPRGAGCVRGSELAARPLEVNAPLPLDVTSPLLVGGRADDDAIASVQVRYADGTVAQLPFGLRRAWLLEVPTPQQTSGLADGVRILGLDADGRVISRVDVPPLRDDDPLGTAHDAEQPIVAETVSDSSDLTLLLGVHGRVNVPGATLSLRYPDGTTVALVVGKGGRFSYDIGTERQHDFADANGLLIARVNGKLVASVPVYSVAGWHRTHADG